MPFSDLPASFPAAWRDGTHKQPQPQPVTDAGLDFLQPALRTLATATSSHANSLATTALAARQCQKLLRPCDTGGSSSSDGFLPPLLLEARERPGLDPRCILIIDFAMTLREAPRDAVRALGRQMQRVASAKADAEVYAALACVSGLLEALRIGVGDELAPVFGAAAAVASGSVEVLRTATQRVRTAGQLLKHASREVTAWQVLVGGHQDLVNSTGAHEELGEDAVVSVPAAIALGVETPFVPKTVRLARGVGERHAAFLSEVRAFLTPRRRSWGLGDALIPCNSVPIRTKHYVVYMTAVAEHINRVVNALSSFEAARRESGLQTLERNAAWAMSALVASSLLSTPSEFAALVDEWARTRAHAQPSREPWLWTAARALLAQPGLDATALASMMHANLKLVASNDSIRSDALARVAFLCITTRTPTAIRLLTQDHALASHIVENCCVLRCVTDSPTGVLELGVYESGFSEWGDSGDDDTAAAFANVVQRAATEVLDDEADAAAVDTVLRLSLLPENLLSRPWKLAVEALQPSLERAIVRCGKRGGLAIVDTDEREAVLRAVVFRRRCWRAVVDMQRSRIDHSRRHAALVTWLSNESGNSVVFARSFTTQPTSTVDAVIEYEDALRRSLTAADGQFERLKLSARSKTLDRVRLSSEMAFVDAASHAALCGGDIYCVSSTTDGAARGRCATTAVSVLHWPKS